MKIYFAGSIRGGRGDQKLYNSIIKLLQTRGQVLTEHVGLASLSSGGEKNKENWIFKRDVAWVKQADVIVSEVSTPSLGVGYELGLAESLRKKIICLYRSKKGKRLSAMVAGNSKFKIFEYKNIDDVKNIFSKVF